MQNYNWRFVSIPASRGSIMFMLCIGDRLICEFSQLKTRKAKGHPVTEGTTSSPFEYAQLMESWMKKSGVKIEGPTIADYARSVNYGRQLGFIKTAKKPSVEVVIITFTDWKKLIKENLEKELK